MITGEEAWLWPARERYVLLDGLAVGQPAYKQVVVIRKRGVIVYTSERREIDPESIQPTSIGERRVKHLMSVCDDYNVTEERFAGESEASALGLSPAIRPIAGSVLELPDCGRRHICSDCSYACADVPEDYDPEFYDYYVDPHPLCVFEYHGDPETAGCLLATFVAHPQLFLDAGWARSRIYRGRRFIIPTIAVGARS